MLIKNQLPHQHKMAAETEPFFPAITDKVKISCMFTGNAEITDGMETS